jgi:hypothetical protein
MKALLWSLIMIGLLPCVFVGVAGLVYWRQVAQHKSWRSPDVFIHDFRFGIGPWSCELYPRLWAYALLALGVVATLVALAVLLHVPKNGSAG